MKTKHRDCGCRSSAYLIALVGLLYLNILAACQQNTEPLSATGGPVTTVSPTNLPMASQTPTPMLSPTPLSSAMNTATATPLPTPEPTATSKPTPSPVPMLRIEDTRNYMYFPSNGLFWHPDLTKAIERPPDMRFSSRPWSPDGERLALRLLADESVASLRLADGTISDFEDIAPNAGIPLWSPDGRYLLYGTVSETDHRLWSYEVFDLKLQDVVLQTDPAMIYDGLGWSFDSRKIAYVRVENFEDDSERTLTLVILDVPSAQTQTYPSPQDRLWVSGSWSPTAHRLLLFENDPALGVPEPGFPLIVHRGIHLLDLETGRIEVLKEESTHSNEGYRESSAEGQLPGLYINDMPWLPDGERIIYSDRGFICYLEVTMVTEDCPDALNSAIMQNGAIGGEYPSVSPTEEWIGFILSFPSQHGGPLAVIRPDGSDLRHTYLEEAKTSVLGPIWSPKR